MKKRKHCVRMVSLLCVLCILCVTTVFAANAKHPLVTSDSDSVAVDYIVNENSEWKYSKTYSETGKNAYIAGNSGETEKGISQISFKVNEPGELSFDYEIGCYSSGKNYMMAYSINQEMTMDNYVDIAENRTDSEGFRGKIPWTTMHVSITEDMVTAGGGTATVYVAYVRNGPSVDNGNYVAIANVAFAAGGRDITITETGEGSITGHTGNEGIIGQEITLTATPDSGNRFYGWVYNGEFQHCETEFSFEVEDTNKVEAVFAPDGTYEARGGSKFYPTGGLAEALQDAQTGETVMLLKNAILSQDVTVPKDVTLYIPFDENIYYDADTGEAVGYINGTSKTFATADQQYVQLTNPAGTTITVNGTLRVGGVNSGAQGGYQGHLSGAYGQIVNDGTITTNNGSTLDVLGLITGSGEVNAKTGTSVYEGFIVADYAGGTNTVGLFEAQQAPFQHYGMQNIQTKFTIGSGSTLYGYCSLVTGEATHNRTIAPIMSSSELCLFRFAESGTSVTRTYAPEYVDRYDGLGRMTYEVTGGLTFQSMTLKILGVDVSTRGVSFPIPYTYEFILDDGDYSVGSIISMLPGTEITVGEDATFTVPDVYTVEGENTYLAAWNVMDGLHQSDLSTRRYPYADELEADGYAQSAMFVMNGDLKVEANSGFFGLVQTNGVGSITIDENAILSMENFQLGGLSGYDDNRTYMDLSARVNTAEGVVELEAGEEYIATNGATFIQPNYELLWMVNSTLGAYENRDTSLNQYDVGCMSETTAAENKKYHILEKRSVTGEQAMTGTFALKSESSESVMLGDVTGDKKINNQDLIALGQHILGTSLLTGDSLLAADVNSDEKCNNQDLVTLGQYILGTISSFE